MKVRYSWLLAVLAVGALMAILIVWLARLHAGTPMILPISLDPPAANSIPAPVSAAIQSEASARFSAKLLAVAKSLQESHDAGKLRQQLAELRQAVFSTNATEASAAIRRFLDSGNDFLTGDNFQLGAGGSLVNSPSLRVFLLDLLAQVDAQAAVAYSRQILETPVSPDEWAIALRNVARFDSAPGTREFLEQKSEAMLRQESWQRNPSVGFLEAFDVAVHLGGSKLLPPLTELVQRKDNQAVAHAAFLALDRMVIREPAQMLDVLEQRSEMMEGRELTRANYFARADVGDPTQREILERYLLDVMRPASELQNFAGVFPNANFMISQNLLTSNVTPDGATLARRDRDALRVVGEWLADPRFASLQPQLLKIQHRLQDFARQAESNR